MTATDVRLRAPRLPVARGPLSRAVVDHCAGRGALPFPSVVGADPYGEDLQLALYVCYELHYRGFADVPDAIAPSALRRDGFVWKYSRGWYPVS